MSITHTPDGGARTDAPEQDRAEDGLGAAGAQLSTQPADSLHGPALGVLGWLRWTWRQLTSMRVALILLFLLSLAAIPGSLIPQRSDMLKVDAFRKAHPDVSPLYDRLGLFHVYSSPWFSAIYILLFVSLAGCIVPRSWQFVGQLRARPPAAPRHLTRLPAYSTWRTDATPEQVAEAARGALRGRRFRTAVTGTSVAAEKGYLRETGNLIFHVALFGLLIGFALTSLEKAEGGKLIVEGDGFSNNLTQYDDFSGGTLYGADDLQPFGFSLDSFDAEYATSGPEKGTALMFRANIHYWNGADGKPVKGAISVNHPLEIGGEKIYLIAHGYAPVVTVKDGRGSVTYQGPVPFLPQDTNLTSTGVIKAPDAIGKDGRPDGLGFQGIFTPSYAIDNVQGPHSAFPTLVAPALILNAYHGDLGLNSGIPQNVYQLETRNLTQYRTGDGQPLSGLLTVGKTMRLPGGGSLTFDGVKPWASFTVSHQSGDVLALVSGVCAILGLMGSLFVQRRRIWVRAAPGPDGATLVELGGLGRSESARIADELGDLALQLLPDAPVLADPPPAADTLAGPADAPAAPAYAGGRAEDTEDAEDAEDAEDHEAGGDTEAADPEPPAHQTDDEGARA
ncbi:cytochrome c biogenesis protein ResB [Actinacidiphila sp. ITFR-21]|uniref:cytochrome c biogenesis protein ResB n=1 Tax=Actinacidiphila sp. ITFR-21 TaxID=3075199 RepID=UPI002889DEBE|nr:cytochrome c biogenesis protein ResB [Streptomyces sp. ITFR-21]WNI17159.1 cytochrome c biogenesis protein ResB [Streptomyces sp. ITFR-21]